MYEWKDELVLVLDSFFVKSDVWMDGWKDAWVV